MGDNLMILMERGEFTSDEFVDLFLIEMREEISSYRRLLPSFELYNEALKNWSVVQKQLDKSLFWEYDNLLTPAFIEYERLKSEYFWTMGLVDALNQRIQDMAVIETEMDLPDPLGVEFRLDQACEHYIGQLEKEYRAKCREHLRIWKEWEKSDRYLYYKHGVGFAQKLLGRTGFKCNPGGA